MITIEQLLESVDLDFEPRWVTKDGDGDVYIFENAPETCEQSKQWVTTVPASGLAGLAGYEGLKLAEFENKPWQECIYEVPRKTTGKVEKVEVGYKDSFKIKDWQDVARTVENKINELVDVVNALIESNNIHEKQIDKLQMKLEPEKCAVNELKGVKNE